MYLYVYASTGWVVGRVIKKTYREPLWPTGMMMPYQIKLHDGNLMFAPKDIDECVRVRGDTAGIATSPDFSQYYNYDEEEVDDNSDDGDDENSFYNTTTIINNNNNNNNDLIMENLDQFDDEIDQFTLEEIETLGLEDSIEFIKNQVNGEFFKKIMLDYQKQKENSDDNDDDDYDDNNDNNNNNNNNNNSDNNNNNNINNNNKNNNTNINNNINNNNDNNNIININNNDNNNIININNNNNNNNNNCEFYSDVDDKNEVYFDEMMEYLMDETIDSNESIPRLTTLSIYLTI
jgi:hypothetical protein